MPKFPGVSPDPRNPGECLPVVVGAHVVAELEDRPIAGALMQATEARIPAGFPLAPLAMTDLWYLNHEALRAQPTISIGRPECNALSAFLADKLPSVMAIDDRYVVLLDPELEQPAACCWGVDAQATAEGVHAFVERWLGPFLARIAERF